MTGPMDARRYASLPDAFPMWRGGALHGARIAYETWGELNARRDNAILLFTGLSPSAHAAASAQDPSDGWWEGMVGPKCAIDSERFFVICVNSLGSCFGSTGPASIDPATGKPYRLAFPDLSVEDIARAGYETMRSLGIERLDTVMGPSLGGMVVLAFAAQFPGAARRLLCISGTAAAAPFAIALRSIQREAITSDPAWKGAATAPTPHRSPDSAWRASSAPSRTARQRSGSSASGASRYARTWRVPTRLRPSSPCRATSRRWRRNSSAPSTRTAICTSRAPWTASSSHKHGDPVTLLRRANLESALVIGVQTDLLFSVTEQQAIAGALERAGVATRFAPLSCIEGHDAFLVELKTFGQEIGGFLQSP